MFPIPYYLPLYPGMFPIPYYLPLYPVYPGVYPIPYSMPVCTQGLPHPVVVIGHTESRLSQA